MWLVLRGLAVITAILAAIWWFLLDPVPVNRHTVVSGNVMSEVLGTGTLEARTSAAVGPKIAGLISRVAVDEGDRVKAGDTLIFLEDTDFKQQVGVAEADMAAAAAAIARLEADQRRAEAVLAQARLTHQRLAEAAAARASSLQELDKAAEALAIAEAELSRAVTAIVEGQKRLAAAERSLDYQRARLNDTTIEAPFDALVVRRDRDAGSVVTAGSSVLQLVSLAEMWITAWVDETELARLAEGQPARVVFRSETSVAYPGLVARIGREADRETRELVVDVRLEKLPAHWAVGQRAEVYIRTDRKDSVTVLPAGLVLLREGKPGVMVDEAGKARWREITLGIRGRELVEIASGLLPGDVVVSPPDARSGPLSDGRRVGQK
jgi:HlyD family secretion protein